jgi:hypothetical protein
LSIGDSTRFPKKSIGRFETVVVGTVRCEVPPWPAEPAPGQHEEIRAMNGVGPEDAAACKMFDDRASAVAEMSRFDGHAQIVFCSVSPVVHEVFMLAGLDLHRILDPVAQR